MNKRHIHISKKLSLVLRHQPDAIGISLDEAGWIGVDELLQALAKHRFPVTLEELQEVVHTNDKQRFSFSADAARIRANQGHSIKVDLNLVPVEPPELLYHGTATRFLLSIKSTGLQKQNRHHVHLSADEETARKVGTRHGMPVILGIRSREMYQDGWVFYCSDNGVWLTDHVPTKYINF